MRHVRGTVESIICYGITKPFCQAQIPNSKSDSKIVKITTDKNDILYNDYELMSSGKRNKTVSWSYIFSVSVCICVLFYMMCFPRLSKVNFSPEDNRG